MTRARWVTWAVLAAAVACNGAGPALAARSRKHPAPAPPEQGWAVDKAVFQPLEPDGEVDANGLGQYHGAIVASRDGGGLDIVNQVGLEDYVKGIAEVPSSWPSEALKAQAIAARTYALWTLASGKPLCPTDSCQVYAGMAKEREQGGERWAAAVSATKGQVILYKDKPILAMYSSSNGGASVAGSQPYLRAVRDPDDAASPESHWRVSIPFSTLSGLFATPGPVTGASRTGHDTVALAWAKPDGSSGSAEVPTGDFGGKINATQPAPAGLPRPVLSFRFDITNDLSSGAAVLDGRGFGHGIGMSQSGAMGKALRGASAPSILAAYYGGLRPVTLPAERLPATVPVTLATGRGSAEVATPGRFAVVDGGGHVLARAASGTWRVQAGPSGKVRVVPPRGQGDPLAIAAVAVDANPAAPGTLAVVRYRLSVPALVRMLVQAPGQPALALPPQLADAGDVTLPLPLQPPLMAIKGRWVVIVDGDAGGARTASLAMDFALDRGVEPSSVTPAVEGGRSLVARPASGAASLAGSSRRPGGPAWVGPVALLVLGADAVALAGFGRRVRRLRRSGAAASPA